MVISIKTNNSLLPITISKSLLGGNVELDAGISSQFLTGLLIALPKAKTRLYKIHSTLSIGYILIV